MQQRTMDGDATAEEASAAPEADEAGLADAAHTRWPHGPGALDPRAMDEVMMLVLTHPTVTLGMEAGLTKKRLARVLPEEWRQYVAPLVVWFDRAGILAPPPNADEPWSTPRPLALTDPDAVATRLHATTVPTMLEARLALQGGNAVADLALEPAA